MSKVDEMRDDFVARFDPCYNERFFNDLDDLLAAVRNEAIEAVRIKHRCGDTGCIFGCNGMGTNGGCRCATSTSTYSAQQAGEKVRAIAETLRSLKKGPQR